MQSYSDMIFQGKMEIKNGTKIIPGKRKTTENYLRGFMPCKDCKKV